MATPIRATIIQPDPAVPADRFGHWLGINRIMVRGVPLWKVEVPTLAEIGDGVLLLGGIMSAHDGATHSWIDPLKKLLVELVEADVPVLAICLGHQLLAEAFGGQVTVADPAGGEHGAYEVSWREGAAEDPILGRLAGHSSSLLLESHNDAVTALPPGTTPLASSELYPNQAFRVGSALGVQFHPEASPELMGRWTDLDGGDGRDMRRSLHRLDVDLSRNGRLLAQGFAGQLRARALAS